MGEAINLINNFKVDNVIFNGDEYNNLEISLIEELNKKNINYSKTLELNNLYLLSSNKYDNENDNSNIIYINYKDNKFLLMGDAGIKREEEISNYDIDVLKVGHHGSYESSSAKFISSINPKYSIISVAKKNRYNHPSNQVLDNLKDSNILRTDRNGSIMFKIKDKLNIKTCAPN